MSDTTTPWLSYEELERIERLPADARLGVYELIESIHDAHPREPGTWGNLLTAVERYVGTEGA